MATLTMIKKLSMATAGATLLALGVLSTSARAADLVTNGGFETGDFSGWTLSGNTGFTGVGTGGNAHSGYYGTYNGPIGSLGFLSQTLATNPGQQYRLNYFLANGGGAPNEFQALVDGNLLNDLVNFGAQGYTQYTHDFWASSSSTQLSFGFRQDPRYLHLDDVSVTSVPEPGTIFGILTFTAIGVSATAKRRKKI